jgi:hypothetical protein
MGNCLAFVKAKVRPAPAPTGTATAQMQTIPTVEVTAARTPSSSSSFRTEDASAAPEIEAGTGRHQAEKREGGTGAQGDVSDNVDMGKRS